MDADPAEVADDAPHGKAVADRQHGVLTVRLQPSLGFEVSIRPADEEHGEGPLLDLSWHNRSTELIAYDGPNVIPNAVLSALIDTVVEDGHCDSCIRGVIDRSDLALLATETPAANAREKK